MLLKWLFTTLAIIWLWQAIRPFFISRQANNQQPPGQNKGGRRRNDDDEGEYIDYEEIK